MMVRTMEHWCDGQDGGHYCVYLAMFTRVEEVYRTRWLRARSWTSVWAGGCIVRGCLRMERALGLAVLAFFG